MSHSFRIVCFTGLVALGGTGLAADYYVAPKGDDANTGAAEAPFATIDKAVLTARTVGDVIHVLPGTYKTTLGRYGDDNAKWGPNLCVKMVGAGATRDEVVLKSHGTHRTLRMAENAWVENMTLEGEPNFKADKGGVVEMTGGVLTNCVVRNGTSTGNGGNLYMTAGVVADCVISNGAIKSTSADSNGPKGVNVCLKGAARLLRCHVVGGTTTRKDDGTFYYERGSVHVDNASAQIDNCLVEGSACGGLLLQSAGAQVYNTTIVTNVSYGVWSWSANQTFVNCIVYGNVTRDWNGNQPTDAAAKFRNCAMATGVLPKDKFPTLVEISDGDFADPANGDWHPVQGSALVDAGGIDPRVLVSKRVTVGEDKLPGVIGAVPIHLQSAAERKHVLSMDELLVDIGAKNKDEAERKAPMGTYISFDTPYVEYGDGFACGKAFDDRVGCLSLLRLLQEELPVDLVACFVSEEEVGCRGAKGAAFQQEPDIGIVLEGTTCNDLGDVPETAHVCEAGQGVTVSFMDGASIANRALFRKALDVAKQENIPHQVKHSVSGGNDGGAIQRAREGVPVVVLSVPCRYIHSPSSVVKLSDVESQFALVKALVKAL